MTYVGIMPLRYIIIMPKLVDIYLMADWYANGSFFQWNVPMVYNRYISGELHTLSILLTKVSNIGHRFGKKWMILSGDHLTRLAWSTIATKKRFSVQFRLVSLKKITVVPSNHRIFRHAYMSPLRGELLRQWKAYKRRIAKHSYRKLA